MSPTALAPEMGLLQPEVVPADTDATAPVLWPLHRMLVLDRMVQPVRATFGAPLKVIELVPTAWPCPRVSTQDVSVSPGLTSAADAAEIGIDLTPSGVTKAVFVDAATVAAYRLPEKLNCGVGAGLLFDWKADLNACVATATHCAEPSLAPVST